MSDPVPSDPALPSDPVASLDRQVATLVRLGYPEAAGMSADAFTRRLAPLRDAAGRLGTVRPPEEGRAPVLLVVTRALVPVEEAMARTRLAGRSAPGFVDRTYEPGALARFVATEPVALPDTPAYLVVDVERGEEFCGAVPADALVTLAGRGRTPLTIEEGVAYVTQFPAALATNRCFSLAGSRAGDKRVPALWISRKAPKLGWCWQGNPHSWLGMASAGGRLA